MIPGSISDMNTRVGMAVLAAESPQALYQRMDELRTWFASQLVVAPADANLRTLRDWHRSVWPDVGLDDVGYAQTLPSAADAPAGMGERR